MPNEVLPSGLSLRDVLDCAKTIEEDFPVQVRVVITFRGAKGDRRGVYVRAQACDARGAPVEDIAWQGTDWPTSGYKTLTAALFGLLWRLWQACDIATSKAAAQDKPKV